MAVLLVALIIGACGNGDASDDGGYLDLLRFVPDTEETRWLVVVGDIERTRALVGVEQPSGPVSSEDEFEYIDQVIRWAVEQDLPFPDFHYFGAPHIDYGGSVSEATREGFGFSFADMDRYLLVRSEEAMYSREAPAYYVMQGRFDADEAARALEECERCPPADHGDHAGWSYYAWERGERLEPPGFGIDSAAMQVAIRDGHVIRTTDADHLHAMIDAREGGSLADDEVWRLLAQEFDRREVVGGEITSHTFDLERAAERWEETESMSEPGSGDWLLPDRGIPVLRPYLALGAALGMEDGESTAYYFLVHETEEFAAENLELAQARLELWLDQEGLAEMMGDWYDRVEVEQDDRFVTVKFIGAFRYLPVHMAPFLHE